MHAVVDHAQHSVFSSPGRFAEMFSALPTAPSDISKVARNLIVHYRASGLELPAQSRGNINARWLEDIIAIDQARHPHPLAAHREPTQRVQGCCRDHTLFCLGVLRSHGIPAGSRVGYAGYFIEGWHVDHVIVEAWIKNRWQRFDPELGGPMPELAEPMDIGICAAGSSGFVTAAQAWCAYRQDNLGVSTYGVGPDVPELSGERFVFDEVIYDVAHRFGDELLLWDSWGRIGIPGEPVNSDDALWMDNIADLLLAADDGDLKAEESLLTIYRSDDGVRPGPTVLQASPYGDPPITVSLAREPKTPGR